MFAIVAYGALNVVKGPFYTLLLYLWIAYFRPETWLWDPDLYLSLDLSWITGIVLMAASVLGRIRWRFDLRTVLLALFVLQDAASAFTSKYFDYSYYYWRDFVRCAIITYLISVLVDDTRKLRLAVLVIVLSVSFESAKQGWLLLLLHPGAKNFNAVAMLGDENEAAVGLLMLVPLLGALAATAARRWEGWLHRFLIVGVIYRAVSTYSRGGFLATLALGAAYLARSRSKLRTLLIMGVLAGAIVPILPTEFWSRMSTITANADQRNEVSEGRLHFWQVAMQMAAAHPFLGVGHNAFIPAYNAYDTSYGEFGDNRAVHSTWFGVLADLGYPGLLLFLANLGFVLAASRRARFFAKERSDFHELGVFAAAVETSMVAFAVGGTFVNYHYSELLWHLIGLSAAMFAIVRQASVNVGAVPNLSAHTRAVRQRALIAPAGATARRASVPR